jgi:hypothetical protein
VQGFYFSPPIAAEAVEPFIRQKNGTAAPPLRRAG